ncbi:MAG: hypothetical protein B6243_13275 [Anaerolineaceae bacterium 4572_5.2]|nr:MAG: hypothetical protein B6243_13275 [Anaerolineaceae bacterium 4572_5.2]
MRLVQQAVFDPPQIPGNGRVIAAIAGEVRVKARSSGPGEQYCQRQIAQQDDQVLTLEGEFYSKAAENAKDE